ncbi:GPW/gp25 family protein [Candidatus Uabimicrobium sp. HlEnr_7]|uniref:GPW/gp25 family protein n=1 Tax=Candidatus Uabimicrobium helgolandensis TaxID=3095367 RepID=UPI0035582086
MPDEHDFLGKGWTYPMSERTSRSGAGGDDSIAQAIVIIIRTMKGERVMRPSFGCDIHKVIFELQNSTTYHTAERYVREALEEWEPRITDLEVKAAPDPDVSGRINISINYTVVATNTQKNLVYPFYITG